MECNWVRLSFKAPDNGLGGAVDSYEVRYSTAGPVTEGNWSGATVASDVDWANLGTPRDPDVAETCTVNGLSDRTTYYFAIKSTEGAQTSAISNSPSGTTIQRQHKAGDWWLYHIRYNQTTTYTCWTTLITNNCYHITNVFATGASKYVEAKTGTGVTVNNLARLNWNCDETANRTRLVATGVSLAPYASNIMHDTELWVDSRDLTMQVEMDGLTQASAKIAIGCGAMAGNGPAENYYTYQEGSATANAPTPGAPDDGYPYLLSQAWDVHQFIVPHASGASNLSNDYNWTVTANPSSFNAASNTDPLGAAHAGAGTYTAWTTYYAKSTSATSNVTIKYAPEVHGFVKMLDRNAYIGWEDWILLDYEVGNYSASGLSAGSAGSNPTINVNITNNTDEARSFKLLVLITDMDSDTTYGGQYKNGRTVFPAMTSYTSIQSAIHTTAVINPGATSAESWGITWTDDGSSHDLWCAGLSTW